MAFTLDVVFTGMCGFVPAPAGPHGPAVHVLLPNTEHPDAHTGHHGAELHVPRLLFDVAALTPGSPAPRRIWASVSLRKRRVELGDGAAPDLSLPDALAPGGTLRAGMLEEAGHPFLASHFRLRSGHVAAAEPGALWSWDGTERPMSHRLRWRIDGHPGDALPLSLASIDDPPGEAEAGPTLYPDHRGRLTLHVYHVTGPELPPDPWIPPRPEVGEMAHHFDAFRMLAAALPGTLPAFAGDPPSTGLPDDDEAPHRGTSPYACMGTKLTLPGGGG